MRGLTSEEVKKRYQNNQYNYDTNIKTNSISDILKRNIFTYFNFLHILLFILVILVGSIKNTLFIISIIINALISIIQDIRSKRAIDKLTFISKTKNTCIRDGKGVLIDNNEIVLNDILKLRAGNQVVVDGLIVDGSVEVNESFITGEELPVYKKTGDKLLSGSFVTSGSCYIEAIHVGKDNYQAKISKETLYYKKVNSVILNTLNKIIKYISIMLLPIGILFFLNQYLVVGSSYNVAILNTVASLITMIPEGLVLLTSTVLAVSVIKLSKVNVLVQELYCIETLARVDTICFDKTGTLTTGNMNVIKDILINSSYNIKEIISEINGAIHDDNATNKALKKYYGLSNTWQVEEIYPFSSEKKYSAVKFRNKGTFIIGSPENILNKTYDKFTNYRTLTVAHQNNNTLTEVGLIIIEDELRKDTVKTIEYFKNNGCNIKLISGDNAKTVYNIAKRLNVNIDNKYIDTTNMNEAELNNIACSHNIFGRVTPQGKKALIKAMQKEGHTVAMIGDGVNDVLALKEADCSISLASGSEAARNISKIILVDNDFNKMINIVNEGRRTINNIESSASLFIVKTIYSCMFAIGFIIFSLKYPFIPIQLSLISGLTIGIPSLVLALEPNYKKINDNFFKNIIYTALPTALSTVINLFYLVILSKLFNFNETTTSTIGIMIIALNGFLHVDKICKPYNLIKKALIIFIILAFVLCYLLLQDFFAFAPISINLVLIALVLGINSYIVFTLITDVFYRKK